MYGGSGDDVCMQVVLMTDWLHLSGPLLCKRLRLCDEAQQPLNMTREEVCGVRGALRREREAEEPEERWEEWEAQAYASLAERNSRDLRVFAAARARARVLLEEAAVEVPPDLGPTHTWGLSQASCQEEEDGEVSPEPGRTHPTHRTHTSAPRSHIHPLYTHIYAYVYVYIYMYVYTYTYT